MDKLIFIMKKKGAILTKRLNDALRCHKNYLAQNAGQNSPLWVRISSTFSVRRSVSYLRPFLYFDLNFTSTFLAKLYFNQKWSSTKSEDKKLVEVQKRSN